MNESHPTAPPSARPALFAAALLALAAPWDALSARVPAPALAAGSNPIALERALATISADEIRSDVFFLASDELGGRGTPSPEQRIAARYLRARLQRLGFQPGDQGGDFLFEYQVPNKRIDEAATRLAASLGERTLELAFGSDWVYASTQDLDQRTLSGPLVWAGSGLEEDLKGLAVQGKWIVCRDGKAQAFKRRRAAQTAEALGVLVLQSRSEPGEPLEKRYADTLRVLREGRLQGPSNRQPSEPIAPVLFVASGAAERLLALPGGTPLDPAAEPALGAELGQLALTSALLDKSGTVELENVVGYWPGSDPALAKEVVILSAHYDHVGRQNGVVYNGADDNGSGTSTLLAVAEALAQYGPLRRSVLIQWVSGEEKGLWGSRAFVSAPWFPGEAHAVADINIDMVGRNEPDKLLVTPSERHEKYNGLTRLAERIAADEGFPKLGSADAYYGRSDHIEFARLGIPIVFLFSDIHEDYHQPGDDPEKIDCDKIRRVARVVTKMLDELQGDKLEL